MQLPLNDWVYDAIQESDVPVDFNYVVNEIQQIDDQITEFDIKCEIWSLIATKKVILDSDRKLSISHE